MTSRSERNSGAAPSGAGLDGAALERTRAEKLAGRLLIILTLVSFIVVGLILNCLQLLLQLTIRLNGSPRWRQAHKRLNGHLLYAIFAQPIFILYAWSRAKVNIMLQDVRMLEDVKKEIFGIIIANHTFELDWMACFVMADQLGNMGAYKCFSKEELKYLPVIGWAFWMSDLVYVKREWKSDKMSLDDKLDALLDYEQILLGIFAEGTRWTPDKHRDSIEFAKRRQMEPFKRHLFPRQRGFNYTMRHYLRCQANGAKKFGGKWPIRLFNLEIAMPDNPNFSDFLEGRQIRADVICEEVHLSEELRAEALNSLDEDDCPRLTELLRNIYRRKDEMLEEYERNGQRFLSGAPMSGPYPIRRPLKAFVYWLISMSLTYGTFVYLAWSSFARSSAFWTCVLSMLASGLLLLRRIERESKPSRPSEVGLDDSCAGVAECRSLAALCRK